MGLDLFGLGPTPGVPVEVGQPDTGPEMGTGADEDPGVVGDPAQEGTAGHQKLIFPVKVTVLGSRGEFPQKWSR